MPILTAPNGKKYETKNIPGQYDPCFCASCGDRIGWVDISLSGLVRILCEDCIADMQEED